MREPASYDSAACMLVGVTLAVIAVLAGTHRAFSVRIAMGVLAVAAIEAGCRGLRGARI